MDNLNKEERIHKLKKNLQNRNIDIDSLRQELEVIIDSEEGELAKAQVS